MASDSKPHAGDEAAVEYLRKHGVVELVDRAIVSLTDARPPDAAAWLGEHLRGGGAAAAAPNGVAHQPPPQAAHQGPYVTAALRRAAQQTPGQTATIDASGRRRTYAESRQRIARLAAGLQSAGLEAGGRVAMLMFNSDRFWECFYACAWAGGCCVPINIRLAQPEVVGIVQDCGASVMVVDDTFAAPAMASISAAGLAVRFVFAGDKECPAGAEGYERLIDESGEAPDAMRGGTDIFGIFYTGGTTGKAKGVMLTHGNIVTNAVGHVGALQYGAGTIYLHSAPMFHLADGAGTFGVTMAGGTHAFIPRFDPKGMLAAIAANRVTHCMMVPVMMTMMLGLPDVAEHDFSSLVSVIYGASPMASSLLLRMMAAFPNARFTQGYGMTETSPCITMLPAEYHVQDGEKLGSVGRPAPWVEAMVVDENDREVPRGTVGEIVTRGPHVMLGYWQLPEVTSAALRGGWMHTGDGGKMDDDGFLWMMDRMKDMIISGGENVYSAEVEGAVMAFSAVAQCAVIGTPDAKLGELVTAVVVAKPGQEGEVTEEALKAHCKALIAGYKCPRKLVLRDALPISGAGKVLKQDLRKEFWEGHEMAGTYGKGGKTQYS